MERVTTKSAALLFMQVLRCAASAADAAGLVDVRPNWKEKPGMPDNWEGRSARENR
jgi:hypothetical protein